MAKNFALVAGGVGTGAAIGATIGREEMPLWEDAHIVGEAVERKPVGSQSGGATFFSWRQFYKCYKRCSN